MNTSPSLLFFTAVVGLLISPYLLYMKILGGGIESSILTVKTYPDSFYSAEEVPLEALDIKKEKKWKTVHLKSFSLPFPFRNPIYYFVPKIGPDSKQNPDMGVRFVNEDETPIFDFTEQKITAYHYPFDENKLFSLPYFKEMIMGLDPLKIWQDIFSKDLTLGLKQLFQTSYTELAYNLFILSLRENMFPEKTEQISYLVGRGLGLIRVKSSKNREEIIFLLKDDHVHALKITTNLDEKAGPRYREVLLRTIAFPVGGETPYAIFEKLPWDRKVEQEGAIYLYASWSHDPDNPEFLKAMFRYFKRKKENTIFIKPLQDFAFRKYGNNFFHKEKKKREMASLKKKAERSKKDKEKRTSSRPKSFIIE